MGGIRYGPHWVNDEVVEMNNLLDSYFEIWRTSLILQQDLEDAQKKKKILQDQLKRVMKDKKKGKKKYHLRSMGRARGKPHTR